MSTSLSSSILLGNVIVSIIHSNRISSSKFSLSREISSHRDVIIFRCVALSSSLSSVTTPLNASWNRNCKKHFLTKKINHRLIADNLWIHSNVDVSKQKFQQIQHSYVRYPVCLVWLPMANDCAMYYLHYLKYILYPTPTKHHLMLTMFAILEQRFAH